MSSEKKIGLMYEIELAASQQASLNAVSAGIAAAVQDGTLKPALGTSLKAAIADAVINKGLLAGYTGWSGALAMATVAGPPGSVVTTAGPTTTTPLPTTTSGSRSSDSSSSSTGLVLGIVFGLLFAIGMAVAVYLMMNKEQTAGERKWSVGSSGGHNKLNEASGSAGERYAPTGDAPVPATGAQSDAAAAVVVSDVVLTPADKKEGVDVATKRSALLETNDIAASGTYKRTSSTRGSGKDKEESGEPSSQDMVAVRGGTAPGVGNLQIKKGATVVFEERDHDTFDGVSEHDHGFGSAQDHYGAGSAGPEVPSSSSSMPSSPIQHLRASEGPPRMSHHLGSAQQHPELTHDDDHPLTPEESARSRAESGQ
jgi:hypothetical protein